MSDYEGVGYLRRSRIRKGRERETISIEKQRDAVKAKAQEIGATKFTIYEDWGGHRSGRNTRNRPDWLRLKEAIKKPSCRFLIAFMVDRSARCVRETAELVDTCQEYSKRLVTCWDAIDTDRTGFTANALFNINIQASAAQYVSDSTSDLMRQTSAHFRDKLLSPWGMWPFGFTRVGKGQDARYEPHPNHAATARTLLAWYASGLSYDAVAQKANDHQLRHEDREHQPKRFTREVIRSIIGNVLFYAGYTIVGQRFRSKDSRILLDGEGTYLERYARAMHAVRSPAVTPLIDDATACALIERRHKNQRSGFRPNDWVALLTPLAYWRESKLRGDTKDGWHYYHTRQRGPWIDGDRTDAEMVQHLSGIAFPPEMRAIIRQKVAARTGDVKRREAEAKVAAFDRQLQVLMDLLLSGQVQREHYNQRYAELERALTSARAELSQEDDVDRLMAKFSDLGAAIAAMRDMHKKRALADLFERVDFADDGTVQRLHLRGWAQTAWGEIVYAYRLHYATIAPGELRTQNWHSADIEWLMEHTA